MPTLEETSLAFSTWRGIKTNKNERIPENLWDMTRTLIPHYKKSHICRELHISGSELARHCLNSEMVKQFQNKNDGFVEAILPNTPKADFCELALQGTRKTLIVKISIQQLPLLLPLIEQYL